MKILRNLVSAAAASLMLTSGAFAYEPDAGGGKVQAAKMASSAAGSIKILTPVDGTLLDANEEYPLQYEVTIGPGSDHFHVWVDDKRGPGIHDSTGTYTLPPMRRGEHLISIKLVDKGHEPTGPEKTIKVIAQ